MGTGEGYEDGDGTTRAGPAGRLVGRKTLEKNAQK
jgi:hypothetical protein